MTDMLNTENAAQKPSPLAGVQGAFQDFVTALGDKALVTVKQKISDATEALDDVAAGKRKSEGGDAAGTGGLKRVAAGVGDKARAVMSDVHRRR